MMSVEEYALDINRDISVVLKKCKELGIDAKENDDLLDDEGITMLDNAFANEPEEEVIEDEIEDEFGEKISNECIIVANLENADVKDRFFKEKFVFKNITYDRNKDYYLVISDEETEIELSRVKFVIDIAISNNFNF